MPFSLPLRSRPLPALLVSALAALPLACSPSFQGNYADPNQVEIVDDKWNETDARLVAERMVKSMLAKPWMREYQAEHKNGRPFVLVDDFGNDTSEQIDTKAMFEATRNELINSGRVRFLDGDARKRLLEEYRYQQSGVVQQGKAKGPGKQASADFFLMGRISSIVSQEGGYKTVTYQVEMRLTNIETSEIVWTEVEKIKKQFRRSRVGS